MAHITPKSAYARLVERLNRFPQGAPPSKLLYRILEMLFSEKEAELASLLPIRPFNTGKAARIWRMETGNARKVLEELAGRGILVDMEHQGEMQYVLSPPMAGFFEFSLMQVREDIDQRLLSGLLYQYLNVEEDFIRDLFTEGETQLGRVFVNEPALDRDGSLTVLDYERASCVVDEANSIGIGLCYCRHKMKHLDRVCDAPLNNCMTFNTTAASLVRHGIARRVERAEARDILQEARDRDLVQFGENVQGGVGFICNCCGCCCEAMIAARRFGILNPVHTTNYLPSVAGMECSGCGKCVEVCPVQAMSLVEANDPHRRVGWTARLETDLCLGCGVCVRKCASGALSLVSRDERVITPVDSVQRIVIMAIERGKLQNLVFDNRVLFSHRALAALLGVLLRLPPARQVLANRQIRSRYAEYMIDRHKARC